MKVEERLQEVFRNVFDDEDITIFNEMTAKDIEDWDSLMHMHLILAIEKEFDIKFTTNEIMKASNVGEFIEMIEGKVNE